MKHNRTKCSYCMHGTTIDFYGKTCTKCGVYKPRTEFNLKKRGGIPVGFHVKRVNPMCKTCEIKRFESLPKRIDKRYIYKRNKLKAISEQSIQRILKNRT